MVVANERLTRSRFVPPWVWHEHRARYAMAATYVKGKTVVDCACGEGIGSEMLLAAGARRLEAFDLAASAVEAAQHRCADDRVRFRVASALSLPLPDRSIDVYVAFETIEHLDEERAFLAEAVRLLRPDGIFLCSTPNRAVTNPGTAVTDRPWNRFHRREYAQPEFLALIGSAFRSVELYGQNPHRRWRVRSMARLQAVLPRHGAVMLNQLAKVPWLLYDPPERHRVRPLTADREWEYLVAVCRQPQAPSGP